MSSGLEDTSQKPNPRNEADERLDKVIAEMVQNDRERKKRGLEFRTGFRFYSSKSDFIRFVIFVCVLIGWYRLYTDQADLRVNLHRLDQKIAANEANPTRPRMDELMEDTPDTSLAAKPLTFQPASTPEASMPEISTNLDAWRASLRCALNARWSDYHSANFLRLSSDMAISYSGGWMYIFAPNFAGRVRMYSGPFWQKPLGLVYRLLGKQPRAWSPYKDVSIPYMFTDERSTFRGTYYARVYRAGIIDRSKAFNFGVGDHTQAWLDVGSVRNIWPDYEKTVLEPHARAMLKREIEKQIQRYESGVKLHTPLLLSGINDTHGYDQWTHKACQAAANFIGSAMLTRAAHQELTALTQNGAQRHRPAINVTRVKSASASFPVQLLASHINLNSQPIAACMRRFEKSRLLFAFSVRREGVVDPASLSFQRGSEPLYRKCIAREVAAWRFPGPLNGPNHRFEIEMKTSMLAH